jgi:hypothetical protein
MSCWCGHRPWHHWHGPWHYEGYGYGSPPPGPYGPGPYRPGPYEADYGPRRRRPREQDLADYLEDLEGEVRQVREELERLRQSSERPDS